jgi:adenylate cyclase
VVERVVMFVDVSGSSHLYKELGDQPALQRVRACLGRVCEIVEQHNGRTIKHIGDGLMCDFATADEALRAAESMQARVEEEERLMRPNISIRVGCHFGYVVESRGDLFGDTVNIAARIADVARAAQIITTKETVDALAPMLQKNLRRLDQVSVKGQSEPIVVFEYVWGKVGDFTVIGVAAIQTGPSRLKVVCGPYQAWLDPTTKKRSMVVGRNVDCELVVPDFTASRQHATIEVRGDKFVLIDHSANGTYVAWGATETYVKREEMILPPRGRLGLGAPTAAQGVTILEFSHER